MTTMDREAYEGLLIAVLLASVRKVKASLRHVGTEDFQDYPAGILELGTALDAIDMIVMDMLQAFRDLETTPLAVDDDHD